MTLAAPLALLSRGSAGWRFEGEAFPAATTRGVEELQRMRPASAGPGDPGASWAGVVVGSAGGRDWMLLLPGSATEWEAIPGLETVVEQVGRRLEQVQQSPHGIDPDLLNRRLFAYVHRVARTASSDEIHRLTLRAIASLVNARTGAFAIYAEREKALAITATVGYPLAAVQHLRIAPGVGVIGKVFESRRAVLVNMAGTSSRRLRYHTDSYIAAPVGSAGRPLAVVSLTDRADGQPFDESDLRVVRLFSGVAALALLREQVTEHLDELTKAATVDPVTDLFNRRYLDGRLLAEVQRARRHQSDLALLMVDIDDFKRINDTFGHLEGDRVLRGVGDLLRGGVRIFDVCARFGGEEFAIVMPGANEATAFQVAERIRTAVQDRFRRQGLPVTVSVGVGVRGVSDTADDLVAIADSALLQGKRAGKNTVRAMPRTDAKPSKA